MVNKVCETCLEKTITWSMSSGGRQAGNGLSGLTHKQAVNKDTVSEVVKEARQVAHSFNLSPWEAEVGKFL